MLAGTVTKQLKSYLSTFWLQHTNTLYVVGLKPSKYERDGNYTKEEGPETGRRDLRKLSRKYMVRYGMERQIRRRHEGWWKQGQSSGLKASLGWLEHRSYLTVLLLGMASNY